MCNRNTMIDTAAPKLNILNKYDPVFQTISNQFGQ